MLPSTYLMDKFIFLSLTTAFYLMTSHRLVMQKKPETAVSSFFRLIH